jgi:hypothetical protein
LQWSTEGIDRPRGGESAKQKQEAKGYFSYFQFMHLSSGNVEIINSFKKKKGKNQVEKRTEESETLGVFDHDFTINKMRKKCVACNRSIIFC